MKQNQPTKQNKQTNKLRRGSRFNVRTLGSHQKLLKENIHEKTCVVKTNGGGRMEVGQEGKMTETASFRVSQEASGNVEVLRGIMTVEGH